MVGYNFSVLYLVWLIFNKLNGFEWLEVDYEYFEVVLDSKNIFSLVDESMEFNRKALV